VVWQLLGLPQPCLLLRGSPLFRRPRATRMSLASKGCHLQRTGAPALAFRAGPHCIEISYFLLAHGCYSAIRRSDPACSEATDFASRVLRWILGCRGSVTNVPGSGKTFEMALGVNLATTFGTQFRKSEPNRDNFATIE
jgi:hypothetical protein